MVGTPIPHSLKSEARKAAKILRDFTMPSAKSGIDKTIPADLITGAAGLAILSVVKVGFLVTVRGGSGIVIARDENNEWTAPSAIGIAGLGGGFELGGEVTDFVIILNKKNAVEAFSKGGNLTLGGNFTVAAGPYGRNMEGDVAVRSAAAIYTYSKTKGLFAGVSVEGSYLVERKDCNKKFYREPIRAYDILSGDVERPEACAELYDVLDRHQIMYDRYVEAQGKKEARREAEMDDWGSGAVEGRAGSHSKPGLFSRIKSSRETKTKSTTKSSSRNSSYTAKAKRTVIKSTVSTATTSARRRASTHLGVQSDSDDEGAAGGAMRRTQSLKQPGGRAQSLYIDSSAYEKSQKGHISDDPDDDAPMKVQALWQYDGQMPCDLSFVPGDVIVVLTSTDNQEDWWEGTLHGRTGIFPANYVQLL